MGLLYFYRFLFWPPEAPSKLKSSNTTNAQQVSFSNLISIVLFFNGKPLIIFDRISGPYKPADKFSQVFLNTVWLPVVKFAKFQVRLDRFRTLGHLLNSRRWPLNRGINVCTIEIFSFWFVLFFDFFFKFHDCRT